MSNAVIGKILHDREKDGDTKENKEIKFTIPVNTSDKFKNIIRNCADEIIKINLNS